MKKFFPLIALAALVFLFFKPLFLNNLLPIPSDTIVGLYHPYRDFFAKDYPRGIAFKNFLITDPVRQLYPWKSLAISIEKKAQLPLWNPYNFSGTPLLANFQSGVFYPLNIFLFLLPFSLSWSLLVFLQPLLGSIFMYLYLRNLKLNKYASFLGSSAFVFSGFFISWLEWNNVSQVIIWVPLVLLAKDKLIEKWTFGWMIIFFFAETCAFLAGHLQIVFYSLCITNLYLFARVFQKTAEINKKRKFLVTYAKVYLPFLLVGILMYLVTSIQWLPTFQFIKYSARDIDQLNWMKDGWFIPWQNLIQFIAPDFFGNPATLNYYGVWNYGEFVGYIGIIPLIFALFAMFFRRDKKTLFFGTLVFVSLIFALPTVFAKLPYNFNLPFISTAQPTRLIFVTDFSLVILATLGFDLFLKEKKKQIFWVIGSLGFVFLILWVFIFGDKQGQIISIDNLGIAKRNLLLPTVIFFLSSILIALSTFRIKVFNKKLLIYLLLIVTLFDLIRFAQKFTPFTSSKYLFPNTNAINFLKNKIGNYRYMTTDSRIFPPNFSIMYGLQSVDGYDPLYLKNYAELIAASERGKPNIDTPFGYNRIITPHNYNSQLLNLLGVKYILSLSDISSNKLTKVFQEGDTRIYENKNVFSRVFFVKNIIFLGKNQDIINKMFDKSINLQKTAIVENATKNESLSLGTIKIINYSENFIVLSTKNNEKGFLVLTDTYYPSWAVEIDGKPSKIYRTDYNFRGIFVPKGQHKIIFSDRIL